jgi:hypothetical protein
MIRPHSHRYKCATNAFEPGCRTHRACLRGGALPKARNASGPCQVPTLTNSMSPLRMDPAPNALPRPPLAACSLTLRANRCRQSSRQSTSFTIAKMQLQTAACARSLPPLGKSAL